MMMYQSNTNKNLSIETCCPHTIMNIIKFCCVWLIHHYIFIKTVWHVPLLCVQWRTPDDGQRNCLKHVEFYSKNKFEKLVHLVGFIIRISHHICSWPGILNRLHSYTRCVAYGILLWLHDNTKNLYMPIPWWQSWLNNSIWQGTCC